MHYTNMEEYAKVKISNLTNRPASIMKWSFVICILLVLACFAVGNLNIDFMDYGYGIIVILLFLALSAAVTGFVYIGRARAFKNLTGSIEPIATWEYTPEYWKRFVQLDFEENKLANKGLLKVVLIIILVVGGALTIIINDILVVYIMGGLVLLLTIVAFLVPAIRKNRSKNGPQVAIIGKNALFCGGTFQVWGQMGISLKKVTLHTKGSMTYLSFLLQAKTLQGFQHQEFRVPVPENFSDQAKQIVDHFKKAV